MKRGGELNFLDVPLWIILENLHMYAIVVKQNLGPFLKEEREQTVFKRVKPLFVERIVEVEKRAMLRKKRESISDNDLDVAIASQSTLGFPGDRFVDLNTDNLVSQSLI